MAKSMQVLKMVYHGVYTVQFYTTPNITNPYKIYYTDYCKDTETGGFRKRRKK